MNYTAKRYKVIDKYPKSEFPIGTILIWDIESAYIMLNGKYHSTEQWPMALTSSYYLDQILKVKDYPNIFKKLKWYEDRLDEDMPQYIKGPHDEVFTYDKEKFTLDDMDNFLPATQEEYKAYANKYHGKEKGDPCNRNGCTAILDEHEKEACKCFEHPPCNSCMTDTTYCPECGWEAADD